jgi:streptogrisin D
MRYISRTTALVVLVAASLSVAARPAAAADPTPEADVTAAHLAQDRRLSVEQATAVLSEQNRLAGVASRLATALGERSGGAYFAADTTLTVTVTDQSAAEQVRAAGGVPRMVSRNTAALEAIVSDLNAQPVVPNSSFGVDVAANQVVVELPSRGADALRSYAARYGSAVRIETVDQTLTPQLAGGDRIPAHVNPSFACSAGFNVKDPAGNRYVLTAGHCMQYSAWDIGNGNSLGVRSQKYFPTFDYGTVLVTAPVGQFPAVNLYNHNSFQPIKTASESVQGQYVCKSGLSTFVTCGTVLAKGMTVNYPGGNTVYWLDLTDLCTAPGDSGGAMFAGSTGLGMVSGGSGSCVPHLSASYFFPLDLALTLSGTSLI